MSQLWQEAMQHALLYAQNLGGTMPEQEKVVIRIQISKEDLPSLKDNYWLVTEEQSFTEDSIKYCYLGLSDDESEDG